MTDTLDQIVTTYLMEETKMDNKNIKPKQTNKNINLRLSKSYKSSEVNEQKLKMYLENVKRESSR